MRLTFTQTQKHKSISALAKRESDKFSLKRKTNSRWWNICFLRKGDKLYAKVKGGLADKFSRPKSEDIQVTASSIVIKLIAFN